MSTPESARPSRPSQPSQPEYGEYATPEEQAAQRGTPVPVAVPVPGPVAGPVPPAAVITRPPRAGDRLASQLLLVVGALGVWLAVSAAFSLTEAMANVYLQYGIEGEYQPTDATRIAQIGIAASHVLLYLAALIGTVRLIRQRRRSFWLPLAIGVLAAIIFFVMLTFVMISDPNVYDYIARQSGVAG